MRHLATVLASVLVAVGCSSSSSDSTAPPADVAGKSSNREQAQAAEKHAPSVPENTAVAYFAGGCFWGVEHFLEKIDGVHSVESGYMGGDVDDPTYEQVTSKTTGHLETVRVHYDPDRVDYETIARRFFEIHDPTQEDGQGPDIGPQYRSAVFVANEEQRKIVKRLIGLLEDRGYDVVTEIRTADAFYEAEDYHQDYYAKSDKTPYCHAPVDRFGDGT